MPPQIAGGGPVGGGPLGGGAEEGEKAPASGIVRIYNLRAYTGAGMGNFVTISAGLDDVTVY